MLWKLPANRVWGLGRGDRPRVMGVLNVTPDSFSDGGVLDSVETAVEAGVRMARAGALVLDVGGESTRPGAERVGEAEQRQRVVPVVEGLVAALSEAGLEAVVSVDTTLGGVAEAALDAGAVIVNDVSGGLEDAGMLGLCAERGCGVILMHMRGSPGTMQDDPVYGDVVAEVGAYLSERVEAALAAGVNREAVVVDPGFGFGKTLEHNVALFRALGLWCGEGTGLVGGRPLMVGVSRKRMIAALSPGTGQDAGDRLGGTVAMTGLAVRMGVRLIRVHDVRENLQAAEVAWGLSDA
ncbi:MAG: dihydropteroate synthase [Phycisphaeraceae bacterium]